MTVAQLIPRPRNLQSVKYRDGATRDIMLEVLQCANETRGQLTAFARNIKGPTVETTCKNLWHFVHDNIRYKEDPNGVQWVKEPARLWADKVGDCKSFSVFISNALSSLGIANKFRFVSFNPLDKTPTHVYVVVPIGGKLIKVDAVVNSFNFEKPYQYKQDFSMAIISRLSGTNPHLAGGLFNDLLFGADRKTALFTALPEIISNFLWMYIPENQVKNLPAVLKEKREKAYGTSWDWGAWAKLKVETQLYPVMRTEITKKLGMTPEEFFNRRLGVSWSRSGIAGILDFAASFVPGASVATNMLTNIQTAIPFKFPLVSFAPDESDWSALGVRQPTQESQPGTYGQPYQQSGQTIEVPDRVLQNLLPGNPGTKNNNTMVPATNNNTLLIAGAALVAVVLLTRK